MYYCFCVAYTASLQQSYGAMSQGFGGSLKCPFSLEMHLWYFLEHTNTILRQEVASSSQSTVGQSATACTVVLLSRRPEQMGFKMFLLFFYFKRLTRFRIVLRNGTGREIHFYLN